MLNRILLIVLVFLVLVLIFILGIIFSNEVYNFISRGKIITKDSNNYQEFVKNCENMSLIGTSYCLENEVWDFFIYNKTNDSIELSFEELKTRGGDCRDWTLLYISAFKDLGFKYTQITIPAGEDIQHTFLVVYDKTGYCLIDMLTIDCTLYSIDSNEYDGLSLNSPLVLLSGQ